MPASTRAAAPPRTVVRRMVELACLAPSVHNTQPWTWRISGPVVWLYADHDRKLEVEDPLGRNMLISSGAALHHFQTAARALGWRSQVERFPDVRDPTVVAQLRLHRDKPDEAAAVLEAMRNRCTDRRRFTSWPVPDAHLEALAEEARAWDASAVPVLDIATRFRLELAIGRALDLQERDPDATIEQRRWTGRAGDDGVPLAVVREALAGDEHPHRFGSGLLRDSGAEVESSDALIVLGGETDDPPAWVRTGEALSALWIRATRTGLSVVPLSQPVEVPATRAELHQILGGSLAPHLLLRIGWQAIGRSELPRTLRRPVDEVLRP